MGHNLWLHFVVDEHPFATYFVHQGYRVLTHSQVSVGYAEMDLAPSDKLWLATLVFAPSNQSPFNGVEHVSKTSQAKESVNSAQSNQRAISNLDPDCCSVGVRGDRKKLLLPGYSKDSCTHQHDEHERKPYKKLATATELSNINSNHPTNHESLLTPAAVRLLEVSNCRTAPRKLPKDPPGN